MFSLHYLPGSSWTQYSFIHSISQHQEAPTLCQALKAKDESQPLPPRASQSSLDLTTWLTGHLLREPFLDCLVTGIPEILWVQFKTTALK